MNNKLESKNILVSIIIPCYNYAQYVEHAIKSVLEQTYQNIEIIVINDGSTDSSHAVISKLQKRHNFKYIKQENQGIIATRNKGVGLARGEYLVQLDADDLLDSLYIEKTLELAQKDKADIVYTQAHLFGRVDFITDYPDFNIEYLKHNNFIHASALIHKSVFIKRKYDSYLNDKWYEDWDLFLDACLDGHTAVLCKSTQLHYRKHEKPDSRSDDFENKFKEILVRHHVLSKQNAKHPKQMWYFSPYIETLKSYIDKYEIVQETRAQLDGLEKEVAILRSRIQKIKRIPPIRFGLWLKRLLR